MTTGQLIWALIIGAQLVVNLPFVFNLILNWKTQMALDFTKLQAAASDVATKATALQAQAAASNEAADQSAIDSVTASLASASETLASLLPAVEAAQ